MKKEAEILVIIVSYNFERWMEKCLGSLQQSTMPVDVIVIDNASQDNTTHRIRNEYPWVHLIANNENLGFGQANNIGMKFALANDYKAVFLLNQDAWIAPDVIETLHQVSKANPTFGILSPKHLTGNGDKLDPGFAHYINQSALSATDNTPIATPFINAAIWYIPTAVLQEVGGFSPLFYHYGEDKDYVNRLTHHAFQVGFVPTLHGFHDREYRPVTHEKFLHTEYVYLLSEYANPHRSTWMSFAYSVLAGIKKSCLSLCRGKFTDALAYVKISFRLLCRSRDVLRVRKQIKTKQPNFLAS